MTVSIAQDGMLFLLNQRNKKHKQRKDFPILCLRLLKVSYI